MTAIAPSRSHTSQRDVIAAKARLANKSAAKAIAGMRARREPDPETDDNPNAEERWSPDRRHSERETAEAQKHEGETPAPRSSWDVDSGEVRELDFGGDR